MDLRQQLIDKVTFNYPKELPISQSIEDIRSIIINNQVSIISGETGSGKTTQLPKLLLELGFANNNKIIGHTQPRRIAAKTLANRIASEISSPELVGYKMRFHDKTRNTTAIKLMTDGILLQEISHDKMLSQYSVIILDEAHERSLNIDFLLGYFKQLLPKRPDLKLIITSATIDNDKLSNFFNNAPSISVSGKTYPVDIIYQPLEKLEENQEPIDINQGIYQAIQSCLQIELGNVLIFLPGEREIKECISYLNKTQLKNYQLLPLYSRQNTDSQNAIFNQNGELKIIATTNIAETSLTIPGIKYVIDSGKARIKRYNTRNRVEQLLIEPISKSSAKQRSGRSGRTSHGMCIRLYSEHDYKLRNEYTEPEILRSNLSNVVLKLLTLNLGNPLDFPLLDNPPNRAFTDAYNTLIQVGAVNSKSQITKIGNILAKIPIDVRLAKILITSTQLNALNEALIIVSFLTIQDPREYPLEWQQIAKERHSIWHDKDSELNSILKIWEWYHEQLNHKKSNKKLLEACRYQFISLTRLKEWHELHRQLKESLYNLGYKENNQQANYESIHKAILSGFINNIGQKDLVENHYLGTNSKKFYIHPSSGINKAKWIMSCNLIETSKLYGRTNSMIDPKWLIPITQHLVKYNYSDQHWSMTRGEVIATKSIMLYGLQIAQQKTSFGKIDLNLSHELMIKQGLVLNQLPKKYNFIKHNNKIIQNIEKLEEKLRTTLIIIDDELFEFYNSILPKWVCDIVTLDKWLYLDSSHESLLCIDESTLMNKINNVADTIKLYPEFIYNNNQKLNIKYVFDHQNNEDGMVVECDLTQLDKIDPAPFTWLIPGIIRDKITYIIKSLPKSVRISFNPINEFITQFLEKADINHNFNNQFIYLTKIIKNINIDITTINAIQLPAQFICHFRIFKNNQILISGDDILELKNHCKHELQNIVSKYTNNQQKQNIIEWIDDLEKLLSQNQIKKNIFAYLSLIVENNQINLGLISDHKTAQIKTLRGIASLVKLQLKEEKRQLEKKKLLNFNLISLALNNIYHTDKLLIDCINYVFNISINIIHIPKTRDQFNQEVTTARKNLSTAIMQFTNTMTTIAHLYKKVKIRLDNHKLSDLIWQQLDDLIYPEFLQYTKWEYLQQYPRYLEAILHRLDKYQSNINKDNANNQDIENIYNDWYEKVDNLEASHYPIPEELYDFKYKIEELRISLFAPNIKTLYKVSLKRLTEELNKSITP